MVRSLHRRAHLWAGAASVLALVAGPLAGPVAGATGATDKTTFGFDRLGYDADMRSGAIEFFAEIPRELQQDIGYSRVSLAKDLGGELPQCRVESAGYYLDEEVEDGVIKGGAAPIAEGQGQADASPYENPTLSRQVQPELTASGTSASDKAPALPSAGDGPLWKTECTENDTHGLGVGDLINAQGARFGGSTTDSKVDRKDGTYRSTGRAYITGIEGAFDTMTSMMQVVLKPADIGAEPAPVITWRLSFFNYDAASSGLTSDGFSLGGSEVPASEFVDQFNAQAEAFATSAQAFGPAGLRILAPAVYPDQDSGRMTITAPSAYGHLGMTARQGDLGGNQGVRFTSVTWTGENVYVPG